MATADLTASVTLDVTIQVQPRSGSTPTPTDYDVGRAMGLVEGLQSGNDLGPLTTLAVIELLRRYVIGKQSTPEAST